MANSQLHVATSAFCAHVAAGPELLDVVTRVASAPLYGAKEVTVLLASLARWGGWSTEIPLGIWWIYGGYS